MIKLGGGWDEALKPLFDDGRYKTLAPVQDRDRNLPALPHLQPDVLPTGHLRRERYEYLIPQKFLPLSVRVLLVFPLLPAPLYL